jgi:hypothetical protein
VTVRNGQHFIATGSPAPILDGGGRTATAFSGKGASDVWIVGFDITHFHSGTAYQPPGALDATAGSGWLVSQDEIHDNSNTGIKFYGAGLGDRTSGIDNSSVSDNFIHDNGYSGAAVSSSSNLMFDGNEIARNNLSRADKADDVGALGKFAATAGVTLSNNFVHDNNSVGIWFDVDSIAANAEHNRVVHNAEGIVYEISFDALIRDNMIDRNGLSFDGSIYQGGAGIRISTSGGQGSGVIDVSGNQLHANHQGITVYQQDRGGRNFGPWVTRNVHVHDNLISGSTGVSSALAEDARIGPGILSNGNAFDHNRYVLLAPADLFQYHNLTTWTGWHRHEDANGSCSLIGGGSCR